MKQRKRATKLELLYKLACKNGGYFMGAGCKPCFCIRLTKLKKIIEHLKPVKRKKRGWND